MDTRENLDYQEQVQELRSYLCDSLQILLTSYLNTTIIKYNGWKRYSRKIKKHLKNHGLWNAIKNNSTIQKEDVQVSFKE